MDQPAPPATFRLLPSLKFTPQISGQRRWYSVEDPQSGRFLKLGPAEYLVASGLQNGVAAHQIVQVLSDQGFDSPRERVTNTIAWLAKQGLLLPDGRSGKSPTASSPRESAAGARRGAEPSSPGASQPAPQQPATQQAATSPSSLASFDPFFVRLPLLSGALVERIAKPLDWLVSLPAAIGLGLLLLAALSALLGSTGRFWSLSEKLFVEDGRLWWIIAWLLLKTAHEMGHAIAAVRTGSRIRSAGIHFIFLAPVPYVDVTDLWSITNRRQRILVSSAGMLAEMAVAAVAVIVAMISSNLSVQYLCAALATLGTIATLAFNGNPLMKFDGYYILSDLLARPNLWTEAQAAASAAVSRVLNPFADRTLPVGNGPAVDATGTQLSLTAFGLTTMFYRVLMLLTMGWWLLSVWNGIGAIAIAWAVWGWFVRPYWTRRASLRAAVAAGMRPPQTNDAQGSLTARLFYACFIALVAITIGLLPSPRGVRAPGVVGYGKPTTVRSDAEGVLATLAVHDRQLVAAGELIARLDNPELIHDLAEAELKHQTSIEQANALRARGELALLQAEQAKIESLAEHVEQLTQRVEHLEIRAPSDGMVLISSGERLQGRFLKPGQPLCVIVSPTEFEVCASASQRDAAQFTHHAGQAVTVAATGGRRRPGKLVSIDSRGSDHCEQQSLAANYGGPLTVEFATNEKGEKELKFPAPRFELKVDLAESGQATDWIPGQLVWIHLGERPQRVWQWLSQALLETMRKRTER